MFEALAPFLNFSEATLAAYFAVFVRVGAIMALLPGFGEQFIPARIRLAVTLGLTTICAPAIVPDIAAVDMSPGTLLRLASAEAGIGLLIGVSIRLLVMAMQLAGSIAAQSTALVQMAGVGVTPDPMPAIGNLLTIAALALALVLDLHIKVVWAIIGSYETLPAGLFPSAEDVTQWGVAKASSTFALAFSLAAPFVVASLVYNVALGAINRAMPQLMVAFIGAPAITGGSLVLLLITSPVILSFWSDMLDQTLANPLANAR